jgi:hypothetical protein
MMVKSGITKDSYSLVTGSNPVHVTKKENDMCSDGWKFDYDDVNGECPNCGTPTVDGQAYEGCFYSPVECDVCGWAPCDGSC